MGTRALPLAVAACGALLVALALRGGDAGGEDLARPDAPRAAGDAGPGPATLETGVGALGAEDAPPVAGGSRAEASAPRPAGPAEPSLVRVRALEEGGGRPVAGARVELRAGSARAAGTTDGEGRVDLAWHGGARADLSVEHAAHVDRRRPGVPTDGGELVVELVPSGTLVGRVELRARHDLDDVEVRLWRRPDARGHEWPDRTAPLDPGGRFRFDDVAPGLVTVAVASAGTPIALAAALAVEPGEETDVTLVLARTVRVHGRVTTIRDERPLSGVVVTARPEVQGASEDLERAVAVRATTDAAGAFTLDGLTLGAWTVQLLSAWGAHAERELVVTEDAEARVRTMRLPGPASLSGVVLDDRGRPVEGALVVGTAAVDARNLRWHRALAWAEDPGGRSFRVRAGPGGAFAFPAVPSRRRLVLVAAGAGRVAATELAPLRPGDDRNDVELRVARAAPCDGRVVDPDGRPVPDATVRADLRVPRSLVRGDEVSTDADGAFRLEAVPLSGVALHVSKEGWTSARVRPRAGDARFEPVEVVLERELAARGSVVDPDGYAIAGARVLAERRRLGDDGKELVDRRGARADAYGRFVLDDLLEGEWRLRARADGFRSNDDEDVAIQLPGTPAVVLVLAPEPEPPRASVEGELVRAGTGEPLVGLSFDGLRRGSVSVDGTRFTIRGIVPGRTRIVARAPGYERVVYPRTTLRPGEHRDLGRREVRHSTRLLVRVHGEGGRALRDADVRLERLPRGRSGRGDLPRRLPLEPTGRAGEFVEPAAPRAVWRLVVERRGHRPERREVRVRGGTQRLRVDLEPRTDGR